MVVLEFGNIHTRSYRQCAEDDAKEFTQSTVEEIQPVSDVISSLLLNNTEEHGGVLFSQPDGASCLSKLNPSYRTVVDPLSYRMQTRLPSRKA